MNIDEYMHRVIRLFQSGRATPIQWAEMARAVLAASEGDQVAVENIDADIDLPDFYD